MQAPSHLRFGAQALLVAIWFTTASAVLVAQDAASQQPHDMAAMSNGDGGIPATRQGSGTSWLPDESPMYAWHHQARSWMLMSHANVFLQYLKESGDRGSEQTGSVNWVMGMAQHRIGTGQLLLRGMVSLEPWTIGGCGYPNLLATGEECRGDAIHDRQHPHDLFMEFTAQYDRPLGRGMRMQLYGGPAGEPALGPVAFMHRVSALPNVLAPMTHHWFDSTHITYGVVTGGLYGTKWKAEASLFNGREPDEHRTDFDFAAMDSFSGRAWFLPNLHWALQASAGRLREAEAGHDGKSRVDVNRVTASVTYHRTTLESTVWASTIGWGRNAEAGLDATSALLVESSVTMHERHALFGRLEWSEKSGHDLVVPLDGIFTIAKLQGGYTRYFAPRRGLAPGVGATVSMGIVPQALESTYGGRFNTGVGVYLTLRPSAH